MTTSKISDTEIDALKVASLPTRPTAPTAFGGKGYTATEMKEAFDKLPLKIIEEFNALIDDIATGALAELLIQKEPFKTMLSDLTRVKSRLGL